MEYHEPDKTWEIWGISDYDTYLKQYMIRGRFHNNVPKEVKDAYRTVEYLIAHAYYFYPMFDEALSKVLRTMEMAVKLKCQQLGVPLERPKRQGATKMVKRDLIELIREVISAEPEKDLHHSLDSARYLRNSLMHPDRNSYMGGLSFPRIIYSVNTFNMLFAPSSVFVSNAQLKNNFQSQVNVFKNKILVLERNETRYLILSFEVTDAFILGNTELVCIYIIPVLNIPNDPTEKQGYAKAFSIICEKFVVESNGLRAIEYESQKQIAITVSEHPQNFSRTKQYREYLEKFYNDEYDAIQQLYEHDKYKGVTEFRYSLYHLIS